MRTAGYVGDEALSKDAFEAIRLAMIDVKIALSSSMEASVQIALPGHDSAFVSQLSRETFENIVGPLIMKTKGPCIQAMRTLESSTENLMPSCG